MYKKTGLKSSILMAVWIFFFLENRKQKTEQYLCNICGKDYTKKWVLEQHMASIHNEGILDKKYKCDHCVYASVMR